MESKDTAVFGIDRSYAEAERGVDRLAAAGFSNNHISALLPDHQGSKDFAHEKNTKAPDDAGEGLTPGSVVSGTLGFLAGMSALAIPGLGPIIAAGPIMATMASLKVGGALGGLVGPLVALGLPEREAERYEGRVKAGGVLLSVHCANPYEVSGAKDLLLASGAEDVFTPGEHLISADSGQPADSDRSQMPAGESARSVAAPAKRSGKRLAKAGSTSRKRTRSGAGTSAR